MIFLFLASAAINNSSKLRYDFPLNSWLLVSVVGDRGYLLHVVEAVGKLQVVSAT